MRSRISTTLLLLTIGTALLGACGQPPLGEIPPLKTSAQASIATSATEGRENPGQVLRIDLSLDSEAPFVLLVRVTNQSAQAVKITDVTTWSAYTNGMWGWSIYIIGPDGPYGVVAPPAAYTPPSETDTIVLAPGATQETRIVLDNGFVSFYNAERNTLSDTPGTYQATMIYAHGRLGIGQDTTVPSSRSRTLVWTIMDTTGSTLPATSIAPTQ